MNNLILDADNAPLVLTKLNGSTTVAIRNMSGLPLGTVGASATGELGVKVLVLGTLAVTATIGSALPAGDNNIGNVDVVSIPVTAATVLQNAAGADGVGTALTVAGYATCMFQVTGTFSARVNFEGSVDGTNFFALDSVALTGQGGNPVKGPSLFAAGAVRANVGGLTSVRARISDWASGTVTVTARAIAAGSNQPLATSDGLTANLGFSGGAADGTTNASAVFPNGSGFLMSGLFRFNGTTWDRERNNIEGTAHASAARTTALTGSDITNFDGKSLMVVLDVTSITGAPSLTLTVQGKTANGIYFDLLVGAAVTTVSTNRYTLALGVTVVANAAVSNFLPRTFRINVAVANADSATYSVSYIIGK